jgi:hypothetical protein
MKLSAWLRERSDWLILASLIVLFLVLKISVLAPHFADGWIYFYFGKLVSAGQVPYQDFYYSSPPLIPYLMGIFHALFGFKLNFANLLPTLFSALDAALIFVLLRKKIGSFALLAVLAYLFSFLNFATTDYFSEAHPLTTFALVGLLFFSNKQFWWSGIFFGLAGLTKLYGLLPALLLPVLLWRNKAELKSFIGGVLVSFAIPNLVFLFVVGREYLDIIFFNHLQKGEGIPKLRILQFFAGKDFLLLLSPLVLFFSKKIKPLLPVLLTLVAFTIFIIFFRDVYYLYLKIFVATLVLLLSLGLSGDFRKISRQAAFNFVLIMVLTNSLFAVQNYFGGQSQKARIENLPAIITEVQINDGEIYGDFAITPLVALLAEKEIFNNYVDTNEKFIHLGIVDPNQRAEELRAGRVTTILTKNIVGDDIYGLETLLPREFFSQNCVVQKSFPIENDYEDNTILIWQCGR